MCDNNVFTQIEKHCCINKYDFKNILYRGRKLKLIIFRDGVMG